MGKNCYEKENNTNTSVKSSGYLELIENEKLVELLQNKYAQHNFMKKLEELIIKKSRESNIKLILPTNHSRDIRCSWKTFYFSNNNRWLNQNSVRNS